MKPALVRLSKKMSYALRHNPDALGLELDSAGWVDFEILVERLRDDQRTPIDRDDIVDVIEQNDKQRFELVGGRIRAAQGHSIDVDLELTPAIPPNELWHGTVDRFLSSIFDTGLAPRGRTHVHLSASVEAAREVGARRGIPVLLRIDAEAMVEAGLAFYRSANGVWLTDLVKPRFIDQP